MEKTIIPKPLKKTEAVALKIKGIKEPVMGFLAEDVACAIEYVVQEINYKTKNGTIQEKEVEKILMEGFEALTEEI